MSDMTIDGYMLLYKKDGHLGYQKGSEYVADYREDDEVKMLWPIILSDRYSVWRCLVEAKAIGASNERINELAEKWACTDDDAQKFADCLGLQRSLDGNAWCATRADFNDLQTSPAGFGETCLEAIAGLLKELNFAPCKTWGHTIKDLCQVTP